MHSTKSNQDINLLNIITLSSPVGGAQMVLQENVLNNSFNNFVITGNEGILTDQLRDNGVEVIVIKEIRRNFSLFDIIAFVKIIKIIKNKEIDFVISHSAKMGVLGRLASFLTKTRNAFVVHGWIFNSDKSVIASKIYLLIEKIMKPISDHVILVSKYDQKIGYQKKILPPNNTLIYNGSKDLFNSKPKLKPKSDNKITISFVARFSYQKDHETLFKALSTLQKIDLNKIIINLIGEGKLMKYYMDKSYELGIKNSLNFIGETSEVDKYLLDSDLFMLISNYEGLPVSIIEALSVGLPIIASDVGGVDELVDDGLNGFLVTKNDHLHLTEILSRIINSNSINLVSMGEKSRNIFKEKFELNFMTKKTEELVLKILKD